MPGILGDFCLPALLADQQALRNLARGTQHGQQQFDGSGLTTALLFFCVFFVAVWGVARLFVRPEGQLARKSSGELLSEICRAHRLTRGDWWLLTRLARHHRLTDSALLFLDPRWLDPASCGPAWRKHSARLHALRLLLFAGLATAVPMDGDK